MEELQQAAGTFGTRTAHLSVDEVAEALEDFANLHASLWESPRLSRYEWLPVSMARNSVDVEQYAIGKSSILRNIADPACATLLPERSEEHTSELQSLMRISYAVFCLKKKTKYTTHITILITHITE